MNEPAISATGLVRHYASSGSHALDGVDISVSHGEMICVSGPSGSGKSTLLYALSGMIKPDTGVVRICGVALRGHRAWTRIRSDVIGLVFQDAWLLPTLSAAQNVELPMIGRQKSAKKRAARVAEVLELVGMSDKSAQSPDSLSGGERQRVAVARSLVNRPRIILADEPTGELDSQNSRRILELFASLVTSQSVTVVIVTHEPSVAERCSRQFHMLDGKGRFSEPMEGG